MNKIEMFGEEDLTHSHAVPSLIFSITNGHNATMLDWQRAIAWSNKLIDIIQFIIVGKCG